MTQPKGIQHVEPADADELSSLERHCLLKRICEVHEVIQQALLGVDAARGMQSAPRTWWSPVSLCRCRQQTALEALSCDRDVLRRTPVPPTT